MQPAHECVERPNLPCPACLAAEGAKRRIDRPCSACSAGDYNMEYHDHFPPFADEKPERQPKMQATFSMDVVEYELAKDTAKECGVSLSAFCRQALVAYLDHLQAGTLL